MNKNVCTFLFYRSLSFASSSSPSSFVFIFGLFLCSPCHLATSVWNTRTHTHNVYENVEIAEWIDFPFRFFFPYFLRLILNRNIFCRNVIYAPMCLVYISWDIVDCTNICMCNVQCSIRFIMFFWWICRNADFTQTTSAKRQREHMTCWSQTDIKLKKKSCWIFLAKGQKLKGVFVSISNNSGNIVIVFINWICHLVCAALSYHLTLWKLIVIT